MEDRRIVSISTEDAISHNHMKMNMAVEVTTKPVHEGHGAEPCARRRVWAVLANGRFHDPEENAE